MFLDSLLIYESLKMDTSATLSPQYDAVGRGFALYFFDSWLKATTIEVMAVEVLYL